MARARLFDIIRDLLGRGLTQGEVDRIDAELDRLGVEPDDPDKAITGLPDSIGPSGIDLIKRFEGIARLRPDGRVEAYPDPGTGGEPWTIGWGATGADTFGGGRIGPGTVWTRKQADARLEQDLERFASEVANELGDAPRTQAQFDALVSFHYNTGAIRRATLTRKHKQGDFEGAAREFARWNRAGGRVLQGLVRRRAAEAELYREGLRDQ